MIYRYRYEKSEKGIIDTRTGLIWHKQIAEGMTFDQAQEYAERVWPVYVTAGIFLGVGILWMLIRVLWLRRHKQPR